MKTFEVLLTKSYIVRIRAEDEHKAKEYSEYFTSDIKNISSTEDELNYNFKIEEIDCKINQAIEANEAYE